MNHLRVWLPWITLWVLWVTATGAGYALGQVVGFGGVTGENDAIIAFFPIFLAVEGTLAGAAQWLILRRKLKQTIWWVPATGLGMSVGWLVAWLSLDPILRALSPLVGETNLEYWRISGLTSSFVWALMGAVIGLSQWVVLTGKVRGAGWWIITSLLAWGSANKITQWAEFTPLMEPFYGRGNHVGYEAVTGAIAGAVTGAVTGIALVLLLLNTKTVEKAESTHLETAA